MDQTTNPSMTEIEPIIIKAWVRQTKPVHCVVN